VLKQQKIQARARTLIFDKARSTMELEEVTVFGVGTQWQTTFTAKPHPDDALRGSIPNNRHGNARPV
jgi:hypothetical protein